MRCPPKLHGAFSAEFCGGGFEGEKLLATVNRRRLIALEEDFFFAGPETPSHENGSANARLSNFRWPSPAGYAEPVRTGGFEKPGTGRAAGP